MMQAIECSFHKRPLCVAAVGLLLGTAPIGALSPQRCLFLCEAALLAAIWALWTRRRRMVLLLVFLGLGLARGALTVPAPAPGEYRCTGRICEEPERTAGGFAVSVDGVALSGQPRPGKLRLFLPFGAYPHYGQSLYGRITVLPEEEAYRTYQRYRGITASARAEAGAVALGETPERTDLFGALLHVRRAAKARILLLFPENGGIAAGMLLGGSDAMEPEDLDAFRRTGISHLIAVSGLHVGIIAGAFSCLFRRSHLMRMVLTGVFLLFYGAVTAFSPSVLRASLMFLFAMPPWFLYRKADLPNLLALAFLVIVLLQPYALFQPGFQLSFLSVYGLALLEPVFRRCFQRLGRAASMGFAASLSVLIAAAPAMARFFQGIEALSLFTNLLALPLAPFFLIPGFLAVVLSYLSLPLGRVLARLAAMPLGALSAVASAGGEAEFSVSPPGLPAYLLWLLGVLLLSPLFLREGKTRLRYGGLCMGASVALWILL